jgi:predicted transcriptional regulator
MTIASEPTVTSSADRVATKAMTVKLEAHERERIASLAIAKNRSAHFLMRQAIREYLEREEVQQRFVAAAEESFEHYKQTGLHVSLSEFGAWVDGLEKTPDAPLPECHK